MKKFKFVLPIIFSLIAFIPATSAAQTIKKSVYLMMGQSETIRFEKRITDTVHIINPRVANIINASIHSVTIVGMGKGITDLYVPLGREKVRIRIEVTDANVGQAIRDINRFLSATEGIVTRSVGDKVVIEGAAITPFDYGRVMMAISLFGKKRVVNYTKYKPSAIEEINKILQEAGMTTVKATLIGGMAFLEGAVGSKNEMNKLQKIIEALHLKVYNLVSMGEGAQVQVKVRFMEISKSNMINFGLQAPDALVLAGGLEGTVPVLPSGQDPTINFNVRMPEEVLNFKLNMLFKNGSARILAEPKLVCGSGSKAKLQVGGEIPIPMVTANSSSVEWKPFGIMLELQPVANSRGNITIGVKAEVSDVDWSLAVNGVPGFRNRKVSTTVTLKDGDTLIISGLYKNNRSKNIHKFPLLGHIPILGELFKSREYQQEKSSLAIMLTPTIVQAGQLKMKESIQLVERRFLEFNKHLYWDLFLE